jgi:hypothetical protein
LKKAGIELNPEMFYDLPEVVSKVSADRSLESLIEEVRAEAWRYKGVAGKQAADFMIKSVG